MLTVLMTNSKWLHVLGVTGTARELLRVLETDCGYTITAEADVLRDCGDMGQPWTAIKALREALGRTEE